jgi:hypothetical protein
MTCTRPSDADAEAGGGTHRMLKQKGERHASALPMRTLKREDTFIVSSRLSFVSYFYSISVSDPLSASFPLICFID